MAFTLSGKNKVSQEFNLGLTEDLEGFDSHAIVF